MGVENVAKIVRGLDTLLTCNESNLLLIQLLKHSEACICEQEVLWIPQDHPNSVALIGFSSGPGSGSGSGNGNGTLHKTQGLG